MNLKIQTPFQQPPKTTTMHDGDDDIPPPQPHRNTPYKIPKTPSSLPTSYRSLSTINAHTESVACIALCGEFVVTASHGREIMVWQQPDLRLFTTFGHGGGSVKSLVTIGTKIITGHQDSKIRVWRISRDVENIFKLVDTLPTKRDYISKFMIQSNYIQSRLPRNRLWIEHADTISCLLVHNELIYSGSWDRSIKIWRLSDFKCLESINAHDDAINALTAIKGTIFSASADGKIKAWGKKILDPEGVHFMKGVLEGHKDVSINSVVLSSDGVVVYGGLSDGYVMGWDVNNWKMVVEIQAHKMSILCMCMKGDILCSGSSDKSIGIWKRKVKGLTKIGVMTGHDGPIKCLQVSPSCIGGGFLVYSGSIDKSIRVWWVPNISKDEDFSKITKNLVTYSILF